MYACVQTDDKLLQLIFLVRSKISKKSTVHRYLYTDANLADCYFL